MKKTVFLLAVFTMMLTCGAFADQKMSEDMSKVKSSLANNNLRYIEKKKKKDLDAYKAKIDKVLAKHPEDECYADFIMAEIYSHAVSPDIKNYPESDRLYRQAAPKLKGDNRYYSLALYNIGLGFYQKREGMIQNFDSAYVYFERAAEIDPKLKMGIGEMTELGLGVNQDPMFALTCYEEANRGGGDAYMAAYTLRYALEQMQEGQLNQEAYDKFIAYKLKISVDNDRAAAEKIVREAAEMGYIPAKAELGTLMMTSGTKGLDGQEILKWLKEAADAGFVPAMHNYAVYYYMYKVWGSAGGIFKAASISNEVLPYYIKAATQGFAPSQFAVANTYNSMNAADKAYLWYGACVKQGYEGQEGIGSASNRYETIGKSLSKSKKSEIDANIDAMLTSQALSVKTLNAFPKIPMFEGSKANTSEEKEQQTTSAFSGNTALNAKFYQSQYNKYGRKVLSELKNEKPNLEYVAALQGVMANIVKQAEEKGFSIERNEYEQKKSL